MERCSAPGLGSLFIARELDEVLKWSAGRLNSEVGRGSAVLLVPRRSNALLGRRLSLSGEMGRAMARMRGRGGVAAGLDKCLECFVSGMFDVYWPMFAVLQLSVVEESGCKDFARDVIPRRDICDVTLPLLALREGGVTFSFTSCATSSLLK
jgi:hypothetical protein